MECNLLQKCFKRESKSIFFLFTKASWCGGPRRLAVSQPRFQGLLCSTRSAVLISFLTKLSENTEGFVFKKYALSRPMHHRLSAVQACFVLIPSLMGQRDPRMGQTPVWMTQTLSQTKEKEHWNCATWPITGGTSVNVSCPCKDVTSLRMKGKEEEEEEGEDPRKGPSPRPLSLTSRKATAKTKREEGEGEEDIGTTATRPLKMTEIQRLRKDFV